MQLSYCTVTNIALQWLGSSLFSGVASMNQVPSYTTEPVSEMNTFWCQNGPKQDVSST